MSILFSHTIAYFVSPHGYGHAARASAVMAAVAGRDAGVRFEIFTTVPRWFFEDSLSVPFGYHPWLADIGLVQKTPLVEDPRETARRLDEFLPFEGARIEEVVQSVAWLGCRLVVCDIAPAGIAVARAAGLPSLLIENFTWDWIYQEYAGDVPELRRHIEYLASLFDAADFHVQTQPAHRRGRPDLVTPPVGRKIRSGREEIRRRLGVPGGAPAVMITMGGVPWQYDFLEQLAARPDVYFVVPGGEPGQPAAAGPRRPSNLICLPHHSEFFHPDLVSAADAVIGKAGYSTLAEVYYAGVPYGYIPRPRFRESQVLAVFIEDHMRGLAMSETHLYNGQWLPAIEQLLAQPRLERDGVHGADEVARLILEVLD
jgi:UDP:flavonoid glycosyltransferase YjiC (YdhE family)